RDPKRPGAVERKWLNADDQRQFILWCLLPLFLSAVFVSSGWVGAHRLWIGSLAHSDAAHPVRFGEWTWWSFWPFVAGAVLTTTVAALLTAWMARRAVARGGKNRGHPLRETWAAWM